MVWSTPSRRALSLLVVGGLVLSVAGMAAGSPDVRDRARPLLGPNLRIAGPVTTNETAPAVAWNADANQYLVVFSTDRREERSGVDVFGRLVNADGSRPAAAFRISGAAAVGNDWWPQVAYNEAKGEYLVIWEDGRNPATRGADIYGQRLAADGTRLGGNFRISDASALGDDRSPDLAYNPVTEEYLAIWVDYRDVSTRGTEVYGQRLASDGSLLGANFRISGALAIADEHGVALAVNTTSGQYLVVWFDSRYQATRGRDIAGQRLAGDGSLLGGNFLISGVLATGNEYWPAVAYNPVLNQYLVVFGTERLPLLDDYVAGQVLTAAGALVGLNFAIAATPAWEQNFPAVAFAPAANYQYLVTWEDPRDRATRDIDIYARRVAGGGVAVGADFRISGGLATGLDQWPELAYNGTDGEFLVVWQDGRAGPTLDVFAQRLEQ